MCASVCAVYTRSPKSAINSIAYIHVNPYLVTMCCLHLRRLYMLKPCVIHSETVIESPGLSKFDNQTVISVCDNFILWRNYVQEIILLLLLPHIKILNSA